MERPQKVAFYRRPRETSFPACNDGGTLAQSIAYNAVP
jgi:hypothetical protein